MIHTTAALTIASVCSLYPPNSLLPHVFHHFYLSSLVCSHFAAFPIIRCATVLAAAAAAASQHIPTLDTFLPNDGKNLCSYRHHHCPRITTFVTKMLGLCHTDGSSVIPVIIFVLLFCEGILTEMKETL